MSLAYFLIISNGLIKVFDGLLNWELNDSFITELFRRAKQFTHMHLSLYLKSAYLNVNLTAFN